jgi:hypothetical protein
LVGSEHSGRVCTADADVADADVPAEAVVVVAKAADCEAMARPPVIRAAADRIAGAPRRIRVLLR